MTAIASIASYALVRIIVWAMPVLGFLGTVIGITVAIASLSPETMEKSMPDVIHGLGIAFDTTAQALALTMIVMFIKYGVERSDNRLLALVDARAAEELVGRFQFTGTDGDPNVASIRRMSEQVIGAVESLASRQAEIWRYDDRRNAPAMGRRQHVDRQDHSGFAHRRHATKPRRTRAAAQRRHASVRRQAQPQLAAKRSATSAKASRSSPSCWSNRSTATAKCSRPAKKNWREENRRHLSEVEAALGEAMVVAAERQEHLIKQSENLLKEMQIALVEAAEATVRQQEQLVRQGDVMLQVVGATGQVKQLEEALNDNLNALVNTQHFDEMALESHRGDSIALCPHGLRADSAVAGRGHRHAIADQPRRMSRARHQDSENPVQLFPFVAVLALHDGVVAGAAGGRCDARRRSDALRKRPSQQAAAQADAAARSASSKKTEDRRGHNASSKRSPSIRPSSMRSTAGRRRSCAATRPG